MRIIKKFQTEAEFQNWVNSPNVRTPYTCYVKQTGKVHFEEGSDDDYSVTFIMGDNIGTITRPVVGTNMAPCVIDGARIPYGRYSRTRNHPEIGTRIYRNGVLVADENLDTLYNHARYFKKQMITFSSNDIIKVTFNQNVITRGGFILTTGAWVKEIIIGDGITYIEPNAFSNHTRYGSTDTYWQNAYNYVTAPLIKIKIGKNVGYLDTHSFYGNPNRLFQLNLCRKNRLGFEDDCVSGDIYNMVTPSTLNFLENQGGGNNAT